MKSPTVSVVMATYNHAEFVTKAVESVLAQVDVDFELLIADDGSRDETAARISRIKDSRIKFTAHATNRGACVVTNELVQQARGEFVAIINSDDFWHETDKLRYQVDIMRADSNLGACFGRVSFIDREGNHIDKSSLDFGGIFDQSNRSQGKWLRRFFDLGNCLCHPTVLIRRACYQEIGSYDNRLRQLPDLDMWIRLVKRYPIHVSERELISFRILPGENASSQTAANSIRTINEHYFIGNSFFDGIRPELLTDGFGDVLARPDIPTSQNLDVEIALLFLRPVGGGLTAPYELIGLTSIYRLLHSAPHKPILAAEYGIDDTWFHQRSAACALFRPDLHIDHRLVVEMQNSLSWKLTAPLRRIRGKFRRRRTS